MTELSVSKEFIMRMYVECCAHLTRVYYAIKGTPFSFLYESFHTYIRNISNTLVGLGDCDAELANLAAIYEVYFMTDKFGNICDRSCVTWNGEKLRKELQAEAKKFTPNATYEKLNGNFFEEPAATANKELKDIPMRGFMTIYNDLRNSIIDLDVWFNEEYDLLKESVNKDEEGNRVELMKAIIDSTQCFECYLNDIKNSVAV
jgi:hypothetical protein